MAFDESPQGTTLEEMKIMCDFIKVNLIGEVLFGILFYKFMFI